MSASREKKQRQGAGPSEKSLQTRQEQAARKRKTITYTIIGVVVVVLVAALLIWNSGFFQARATAATVGDTRLSTAELSYYYYTARQPYAMYGSYMGFDTTKPDDEQTYPTAEGEESKTYRDYFLETALSSAQRNAALARQALENGHTEADVQEGLETQISNAKASAASSGYSYSAYLKAIYGPYMSKGVFEKTVRQALLADLAYSEHSTELSDGYTEADLTAYYEADDHADTLDTFEYSYLYFTPAEVATKDDDGNDIDEETVDKQKEEALAEAKEHAEAALESLKDDGDVASLASEYELADTAYADHTTTVGSSNINSVFREDLLALDEGESALVENSESGFYVITYHGRERVEEPTRDVRHILINAEPTEEEHDDHTHEEAPTDEAWAAAKAKIEEIQAEWEASDKTEDAFAALANKYSNDGGSNTNGGLYERNADGGFVAEFNDWVFESGRKPGDVSGVIQHIAADDDNNKYWGYHLIYYVGENEPVWMGSARSSLTSAAMTEWVDGLRANYETALANGADYLGE